MNTTLHCQVQGEGPDLVLLHGWGMNSACWQQLQPLLEPHYRLHMIDLPGFGHSHHAHTGKSLSHMAEQVLEVAPEKAHWLGWSLGGLVATQATLQAPERVEGLVTVASSPKFEQEEEWPGIAPKVLADFVEGLVADARKTVERFLMIQAMGCPSARQDVKILKQEMAQRPAPEEHALRHGLSLLQEVDLRDQLVDIQVPFHRIYGTRDSLVPKAVISQIDQLAPRSQSHLMHKTSHAPFISAPEEFARLLRELC